MANKPIAFALHNGSRPIDLSTTFVNLENASFQDWKLDWYSGDGSGLRVTSSKGVEWYVPLTSISWIRVQKEGEVVVSRPMPRVQEAQKVKVVAVQDDPRHVKLNKSQQQSFDAPQGA